MADQTQTWALRRVNAGGHGLRLPFVGREREQALFADAAEQARSGRGSVLLFEGEQGSGKTRLLGRLGDASHDIGTVLLEGRAFDADATPPFWIWRGPLTQLGRAQSGRAEMPVGDPFATPEVAAIRVGHAAADDHLRDQLVVFDALARVFVDAAAMRPTVVLLDDLHWADMASLGFLAYLGRSIGRCGLVVVGTWCREIGNPGAAGLIAETERNADTVSVGMEALSSADVSEMLHDVLSESAARRLVEATGGNAFLIAELARQADGHPLVDTSLVPPSVRSIVEARLARLAPQLVEVVEAASVLGRRGSVSVLAAVVGRSAPDVAAAGDEACAVGLLNQAEDGSFAFRHALVRQAVASRLAPGRAAGLHLASARALQHNHDVDDHWIIAHHLTLASRVHVELRGEATAAWQIAARRAAALGAHADAAAHLEEAVVLASAEARPTLRVDLGWANLAPADRPAPWNSSPPPPTTLDRPPWLTRRWASRTRISSPRSSASAATIPRSNCSRGPSARRRRRRRPRPHCAQPWREPIGTAATSTPPGTGSAAPRTRCNPTTSPVRCEPPSLDGSSPAHRETPPSSRTPARC